MNDMSVEMLMQKAMSGDTNAKRKLAAMLAKSANEDEVDVIRERKETVSNARKKIDATIRDTGVEGAIISFAGAVNFATLHDLALNISGENGGKHGGSATVLTYAGGVEDGVKVTLVLTARFEAVE